MNHARRMICLSLLTGIVACSSNPPAPPPERHEWELLGEREVDFHVDHDAVDVGKAEGRFHVLRFAVHGGAIEMYEVKVILGDGEVIRIPDRLILDSGEGRKVELPGDRRVVKRVEFVYRSLKVAGRPARVSLYGR